MKEAKLNCNSKSSLRSELFIISEINTYSHWEIQSIVLLFKKHNLVEFCFYTDAMR